MKYEKLISRLIILWSSLIILFIVLTFGFITDSQKSYYNFGPSDNLVLIGIKVDNYYKYAVVVFYCFVNTILRSARNSILRSWTTNVVQDITRRKSHDIFWFAYEAEIVDIIYTWIDWYLYINILLTQVDMAIIEIITEISSSIVITSYYLKYREVYDSVPLLNAV